MWLSGTSSSALRRSVGASSARAAAIAFAILLSGCAATGGAGDGADAGVVPAAPASETPAEQRPEPAQQQAQQPDQRQQPSAAGAAESEGKVAAQPGPGEQRLAEGVALYDQGKFAAAIRKLQTSREIWADEPATRIAAYKYLAFSHCVLNRRQPCRRAFDALLKLDPGFDLTAAEIGHPLWGPVFRQAKQESAKRAVRAASARRAPR